MKLVRQVFALIVRNRRDGRQAVVLLVMMTFAAALEALGIGLIMPFVALLQKPELVDQHASLRWLREASGARSNVEVVYLSGLLLVVAFVVKNAYLTFVNYRQNRFVFDRQVDLSGYLLETFLRSPYSFHLQHDSAELIQNINYEISQVINHVVFSMFIIAVEALSVIVVGALLLVLAPVTVPAVAIVLGVVSFAFYRVVHRKSMTLGQQEKEELHLMLKWLQQGLGGIKEARVIGCESFFIDAFNRSSRAFCRSQGYHRMVAAMPRGVLETLGVVGLVFVSIAMMARGADAQKLLPVLGVLAVAAVRVIPSIARILGCMTDMRHHTPSVDAIHAALSRPGPPIRRGEKRNRSVTPLSFQRELRLTDVQYTYPGADKPSLRGVSVVIPKGKSTAFVGSSGAGKTTIVDLLIGLLEPTGGTIDVDGTELKDDALVAWQRMIGYIPQNVFLCDDSILRNVAFGVEDDAIDRARVKEAIQAARLTELVDTLPEGLDTSVGERGVRLSGGQRQRIGIARALYLEPEVLVLDEATSSLDGITEREVVEAIERIRTSRTAIIIAHRLSTVRNCDWLVFMEAGQVVQAGTWDDIYASNPEFRRLVDSGDKEIVARAPAAAS